VTDTGLEYWDQTLERARQPGGAVRRLLADPRFADVLRAAARGALHEFDTKTALNTVFLDYGTFSLGFLALYLHAIGGITHRRLAELSGRSTILSRGRASAMLGMMRVKGLVARHTDMSGQVIYRPSDNLVRFFRDRFRVEFNAVALVEPRVEQMLAHWDEPGTFERYLAMFGMQWVTAGANDLQEFVPFRKILSRRAGMLIVYAMMDAADYGRSTTPLRSFPLSVSALARRFRVSRSQVLRVLREVEGAGFVSLDTAKGEAAFTPRFYEQYLTYSAVVYFYVINFSHQFLMSYMPVETGRVATR